MAEKNTYSNIHVKHGYTTETNWQNRVIPKGEIVYGYTPTELDENGNPNGYLSGQLFLGDGINNVANLPNSHKFLSYQNIINLTIGDDETGKTLAQMVEAIEENQTNIEKLQVDTLRYSTLETKNISSTTGKNYIVTFPKKPTSIIMSWDSAEQQAEIILNDESSITIQNNTNLLGYIKDLGDNATSLNVDWQNNPTDLGIVTFETIIEGKNIYDDIEAIPMHIKYLDGTDETLYLVNLIPTDGDIQ